MSKQERLHGLSNNKAKELTFVVLRTSLLKRVEAICRNGDITFCFLETTTKEQTEESWRVFSRFRDKVVNKKTLALFVKSAAEDFTFVVLTT